MESVVWGFSRSILKATIYSLFWYNLGLVSPIELKSKYKWMVSGADRRWRTPHTWVWQKPFQSAICPQLSSAGPCSHRSGARRGGSGAQVAGQMLQPIVCQIHQYNGFTMGYGLLPSPVLCKVSQQWRTDYLKVQENLKRTGKCYFHMRAKTAPHYKTV